MAVLHSDSSLSRLSILFPKLCSRHLEESTSVLLQDQDQEKMNQNYNLRWKIKELEGRIIFSFGINLPLDFKDMKWFNVDNINFNRYGFIKLKIKFVVLQNPKSYNEKNKFIVCLFCIDFVPF